MQFERPDELCQFEWGYWGETIDRWHKEGLPSNMTPWDHCGITHYFRPPINCGIFPPFEHKILEEDEETRIVQTGSGIICRESKVGMRLPQFLKHPVSNRDDFEALKERLNPKTPGRYPDNWEQWVKATKDFPYILCLGGAENGFFGWLRELMGLENLLTAYIEQPDLIHEICNYHVSFLMELYEKALNDVDFDFVFMWEDMAYKNGPLISPTFVETFMIPYYSKMVDFYKQMGAKWVLVDSDGDVSKLIPLFIRAGVDGMLPFEVAAGMDILKVREAFPKFRILGGIDKREVAKGREAIDRELELKLPKMFRYGGYIPTMDHHVPPEVSYQDFQYYLEKTRALYKNAR